MRKSESWWVVVVNFGGVSEPIRCYKKSEEHCWDRSGNISCSMKAGLWPIGREGSVCSQYQTTSKHEADTFYAGAKALSKLIGGMLA